MRVMTLKRTINREVLTPDAFGTPLFFGQVPGCVLDPFKHFLVGPLSSRPMKMNIQKRDEPGKNPPQKIGNLSGEELGT